jgi:acyl-CoA hydrolase
MSRKIKEVQDSIVVMTQLVMPNDTNPLNNLMGGNLMRWMDVAAAICSGKHCEEYVVTASVDHVSFERAIALGEVVKLKAYVTRAFSTSVEVFVEVFSSSMRGGPSVKCNHAYFTFVAIDQENHKPVPIPDLNPVSSEEKKRYEGAQRRREVRLILAGRIEAKDATEVKAYFAKQ